MKKLFLTLFFAGGIFILWSHSEMLFGNRLFLDEPRVHKIGQNESLSKLAQQYYGDPQRWRELALINRAPNPNHVEVGEEILVPANNVVAELGRARTITQVNTLVNEQQEQATRAPSKPITGTETTPAPAPSSEVTGNGITPHEQVTETPAPQVAEPAATENGFPWLLVGIAAVVLLLASAGFAYYRRRQTVDDDDVVVVKKENNFDDFRRRRQYGESKAVKTESVDQEEEMKDKDNDREESRSRRRYSETTATT